MSRPLAGAALLGLALGALAQAPDDAAYLRGESARARAKLDAIPARAKMLDRIRGLSASVVGITSVKATATQRVFYLKTAPPRQVPVLCVREGVMGAERVLVDEAVDAFSASPDARHVVYTRAGESVLHVLAADGARGPAERIEGVRYAGEIAWHSDSRSFYYVNPNSRVYRHALGRDAARDEIVFASGVGGARDIPRNLHPSLVVPLESRYAYAIAREGVRREMVLHVAEQRDLAAGRPKWRKIAGSEDEIVDIEAWKDDLYLLSHLKAPNYRVLRVKPGAPLSSAKVVVPERDLVVQDIALARDALYMRTMLVGVDRLERVPLGILGARAPEYVRTPFDTAITQLVTHPRAPGAILRLQGWLETLAVVQVDAKGNSQATRLHAPASVDLSAMDEVRLYAAGHDGARIPVTLLYRKGMTLTGANPTLLVAFGSHGQSVLPEFDAARLAWLERGGVFAIAHVRGGGEYGEAWHQAGMRANKTNTILDFLSVADFLVKYGFTGPGKLAVLGTGPGAIPAAGAIVRRPEMFAAAVLRVPWVDMVRFEATPEGAANVPEFGSGATPEGLETLRAISAYHQVRDATAYPAVLVSAGADASQGALLAARLQQASNSGKPVLLRVDASAPSRAQRDEELADIYSFLFWQLGDPDFQVPPPPPPPEPPAPFVGPVQPGAQSPPLPSEPVVTPPITRER